MDSQELRNLSEAYLEVYQDITEAKVPGDDLFNQMFRGNKKVKGLKTQQSGQNRYLAKQNQKRSAQRYAADMGRSRVPSYDSYDEQVDLYDIILSHLLDEGYAETIEGAEVIMVNMSEEWRDSIVDEMLDEANRGDEHVTSSMYMSREPETTAAKVRRRQKRDGLPDNPSHKGDDKDYDRQFAHRVERGRKKLKPYSSQTLEGEKNPTGKYAAMQRRKRQGLSY